MRLPGDPRPLPRPDLGAEWEVSGGDVVRVSSRDASTVVTIARTARTALARSYPVGSTDVTVEVDGDPSILRDLVPAVWSADPACRRIVVAVPDGDDELAAACRAAGFLGVVDVQIADGQDARLYAVAPPSVMAEPHDISDMPEPA